MVGDRNDPDRKLFAEELRAMREDRHWSRDELGKLINFSASTINNIESMFRAPTHQQALLLDKAFGTPGTFARLEARLRGVPFSAGFRPFSPYEGEALTLKYFQNILVPGMFQTEDYARTLEGTYPGASEQDVQQRVAARLARQSILDRTDPRPPWLWIVLDEQALHRNIGGPAVMVAQMERLVELAGRPRINIQVIPADRPHPGLMGAFVIAEMDQGTAILYVETVSNGQTVENPEMAAGMTVMFDALRAEALPSSASLGLIEEEVQRWKTSEA